MFKTFTSELLCICGVLLQAFTENTMTQGIWKTKKAGLGHD